MANSRRVSGGCTTPFGAVYAFERVRAYHRPRHRATSPLARLMRFAKNVCRLVVSPGWLFICEIPVPPHVINGPKSLGQATQNALWSGRPRGPAKTWINSDSPGDAHGTSYACFSFLCRLARELTQGSAERNQFCRRGTKSRLWRKIPTRTM